MQTIKVTADDSEMISRWYLDHSNEYDPNDRVARAHGRGKHSVREKPRQAVCVPCQVVLEVRDA